MKNGVPSRTKARERRERRARLPKESLPRMRNQRPKQKVSYLWMEKFLISNVFSIRGDSVDDR